MGKLTYTTAKVQELLNTADFMSGINTTTTLVNTPVTKQTVYCTMSANQTLSFASIGNLAIGNTVQIFIKNSSATERTITLPAAAAYVKMNGSTAVLPANGWLEIHLTKLESNLYSIRTGGQG